MKNLNEKRMPFILFMVAFIGCVSLFVACSSETDNEINEDKQEETTSGGKTRGISMLPEGKAVVSVNGNIVKFAWDSIYANCGWGPNIELRSSHLGPIARTSYRDYAQEVNGEMEIGSYYQDKEWGSLTLIISTCSAHIEIPLVHIGGSSYSGERIVCTHNFQPRETYVILRASDRGAEIETDLNRAGKLFFRVDTKYPTGLEQNAEWREFSKNISSGKQTTNFSWDWKGTAPLYMGTLWITLRLYDSHCVNLPTDNCSNYIEKRISWSMADSHGQYYFSGNADIIGG